MHACSPRRMEPKKLGCERLGRRLRRESRAGAGQPAKPVAVDCTSGPRGLVRCFDLTATIPPNV